MTYMAVTSMKGSVGVGCGNIASRCGEKEVVDVVSERMLGACLVRCQPAACKNEVVIDSVALFYWLEGGRGPA